MKKSIVLVVLILIGTASWAQSTFGTGQWLHDLWTSYQRAKNSQTSTPSDTMDPVEYMGFVEGAGRVMQDAGWLDMTRITYGQQFAVVGKYLDDHPEKWNNRAEVLVFWALYAVWPGKTPSPYQ